MASHWLGLLLLTAMVVVWVAVDLRWRRTVPEAGSPEAAGERKGCGGCQGGTCTNRCDDGAEPDPGAAGKERR